MNTNTTSVIEPIDALNQAFLLNYPKDAARKIETMPAKDAAKLLIGQPTYIVQPVWKNLAHGVADRIILHLPNNSISELLTSMESGSCATLLSRFDKKRQEQLLSLLADGIVAELKELMEYPVDSAGKLMDTDIIAFNENITVESAIKQLKNQKSEAFHYLFILNDDMKLCGQVDMQEIALSDNNQKLSSLSKPVRAYVTGLDPKDEVIQKIEQFKVHSIPVIDGNDHLIGIIHGRSLMESLKESLATEMQTMVGASKDERALSSSWFTVKKRLPWLQINLVTAFLAAAVVGMFEYTIAKYTALAILLPIAAGQSGNTGAQALAVTMRGLTLREITVRHWFRVMRKEAGAALINGIAIAITCGAGVYIWSSSVGLSLIIALAMISSMIIAAVAGALVPIFLKRIGQDPALSSSIILTTVTDIAGFMSFLGIATMLSGMLDG
ncbi:magnesium transporter [Rickettsiales bacterium]|nr:magnesium transporter [Rickettsiales bacterium]